MTVQTTEISNFAVDLMSVRKTYRRRIHALRGVNIQVRAGEIFGLLGPNGAGKSTLVRIMTTVIHPDELYGTILGRPVGHRGKLARIGYLPDSHRFPSYLTGEQVLDYYGALADVPRAERRSRAMKLLERLEMHTWAKTKVRQYSKGMLQRIGLAQALVNEPDLVILDEPTDGVDPIGRRIIREMLLELRDQGKTIFLNSHLLSELEMICDRVAILVDGYVARQGTLAELTEHSLEYRISFEGELDPLRGRISELGGRVENGKIVVAGHDRKQVNAIIDMLRAKSCIIESVIPHRFSLEDVMVEVTSSGNGKEIHN